MIEFTNPGETAGMTVDWASKNTTETDVLRDAQSFADAFGQDRHGHPFLTVEVVNLVGPGGHPEVRFTGQLEFVAAAYSAYQHTGISREQVATLMA